MGSGATKQKEQNLSEQTGFPLPLFLLSLVKVKEIKSFLQDNQEKIENNKKVKLLQILCDINKSTKFIKDYVKRYINSFSQYKKSQGISLCDSVLRELDEEIGTVADKVSDLSIIEIIFF